MRLEQDSITYLRTRPFTYIEASRSCRKVFVLINCENLVHVRIFFQLFQHLFSLDCKKIYPLFQSFFTWKTFFQLENLTFFQQLFGFKLKWIYGHFQSFHQLENLTVISTMFCSSIIANLTIVSIFSLNEKFNRCFSNFSSLYWRQSIHSFRRFFKWEIYPLFQRFFALRLQPVYP